MNPAVIVASLLAWVVLWSVYEHQRACPLCGGRTRHSSTCPYARKNDQGR